MQMDETPNQSGSEAAETSSGEKDWRTFRWEEPAAQREDRLLRRGSKLGGLALIIIGGVYLIHNLTGKADQLNWEVIAILAMTIEAISRIWDRRQRYGQLTCGESATMISGLVLALIIAVGFFFDLSFVNNDLIILPLVGTVLLIYILSWFRDHDSDDG
jgi:peptidoglycan/LPS O-acetylase OafA/YrhL